MFDSEKIWSFPPRNLHFHDYVIDIFSCNYDSLLALLFAAFSSWLGAFHSELVPRGGKQLELVIKSSSQFETPIKRTFTPGSTAELIQFIISIREESFSKKHLRGLIPGNLGIANVKIYRLISKNVY